ncbi:hypothetical protein AC579_4390 [Pseudocercospora musae]|uniref:Uncharacterized protein n=1 Tax=Pseudocercospora musae TaxID=113226 RepID=A0A139IJT8_9PEZI|nr:hypothetical protein AC579_4390 [Pseudocercospora musae]
MQLNLELHSKLFGLLATSKAPNHFCMTPALLRFPPFIANSLKHHQHASIELTKDEEIKVLQGRLQKAREENERLQNQVNVLKPSSEDDLQRAIPIEQLARAHCHLQNIYLRDRDPEKYSQPDLSQVGEWLVSLETALGEDVYAVVLDKSYKLDDKKYGYKGVEIGATDITASRNMRQGYGFA